MKESHPGNRADTRLSMFGNPSPKADECKSNFVRPLYLGGSLSCRRGGIADAAT